MGERLQAGATLLRLTQGGTLHKQPLTQPRRHSLAYEILPIFLSLSFQLFLPVSNVSFQSTLAGAQHSQVLLLSSKMQPSTAESNPTDELMSLRGIIISTWAIALVAVCLRFLARRLSKAGLWYDDWLMLPATVSIRQMKFSSTTPLSKRMVQTHKPISLLPRCYASFRQPGVSSLNCTESRALEYAYQCPLLNSGKYLHSRMEMDARRGSRRNRLFREARPPGVLHLPDLLGSRSLDC